MKRVTLLDNCTSFEKQAYSVSQLIFREISVKYDGIAALCVQFVAIGVSEAHNCITESCITPYSSAEISECYDNSETQDSYHSISPVSPCTTDRYVALRNHTVTQLK